MWRQSFGIYNWTLKYALGHPRTSKIPLQLHMSAQNILSRYPSHSYPSIRFLILRTLHIDFSTAGRILTDVNLSSFHQPQAWSPLRYLAFSYSLVIWFHICFSHISGRSCSSAHAAWCVIGFGCVKSSPFRWGINRSSSASRLPIETSTNRSQMYYYTQPSVKMIFSLQRYFQSAMTE